MRKAAARVSKAAAAATDAPDILAAARAYVARGWAVVPLPRAAKAPIARGWQRLRLVAADLDGAFADAGGLGFLCGEPSRGLVDVDLDDAYARAAWPLIGPQTDLRHGRASSPESHAWYIADAPPDATERLHDPTGAALIELRSTGGQTVVPPSVHPAGEAIIWHAEGEPARVAVDDLRRGVRDCAAVAMVARRWPDGARHDAAMALAGLLLRGGLAVEAATRLVELIAHLAGDPEVADRVRAVRDTAADIAGGRATTGGPRLAALLADGGAVVARLRAWLELREPAAIAAGDHDPPPLDLWGDTVLTGQPILALDLIPPAVSAMAADEAERLGVDPAQLALPAMAVCAAAIHDGHRIQPRRANTGWTESARIWLALIAPPGGKKSPALARVTAPLRAIERTWHADDARDMARYTADLKRYASDLARYARRGIDEPPTEPRRPPQRRRLVSDATIEALSDIALDNPSGILAVYGELATWIGSHDCYRDRTGAGRDRAKWLELYDGGPQIIDRVRRGHLAVPNWSACILGAIQPGPLRRLLGRITDDGLVQRLIPVWTHPTTDGVDREPDHRAGRDFDDLIARLVNLPIGAAPFTLAEGAHRERHLVVETARHVAALPTTSDAMRGALAKWEGLYARLLLVWHLVEHGEPPPVIGTATAHQVARLMVSYLLPQTARLYAELGDNVSTGHARWVAGWILAHGRDRVSTRDVGRAYRELRDDAAAIGAAMDTLTLAGWTVPADDARPGAPLRRWRVRPAVHLLYAPRAAAERTRRADAIRRTAEAATALGIVADAGDAHQ